MGPISRVSGAVVQPFPSCCHLPGDSKPRGPRLCSQGLLLGIPTVCRGYGLLSDEHSEFTHVP